MDQDPEHRKQMNAGYDPLETMPDAYLEGIEELADVEEAKLTPGARYVEKYEVPTENHPDNLEVDEVDFYVVLETTSVEKKTQKDDTEVVSTSKSMVPTTERIWDELIEEFYAEK